MEFVPLDFFPSVKPNTIEYEEENFQLDLVKLTSEESGSTHLEEESLNSSETLTTSKKSVGPSPSENHNMVKQLIITMKQMIGKNIEEVSCSYTSRPIIYATWKVFEKTKNPSK